MPWRRKLAATLRFYRRRLFGFSFGIALFAALLLLCSAAFRLRPLLDRMASARVSNTVTAIVNEAVSEAISGGEFAYTDLVTLEKDLSGHITALHSNIAASNQLQSLILDTVLEKIGEVSSRELSIPLGNLTGAALLAGRGPRIHVNMESLGSSSAHFENEFTAAGINQTKHRIVLYIDVYVTILLPGKTTATHVSNAVTVAETVIVGSVPQNYTYFSTDPASYEEDAKDHILNTG